MTTLRHHVFREIGPRPIYLTIAADALDVNLFTLAGSPGAPSAVTVTIASGIWTGSTGAGAGLRTGGFPAGSSIRIINNGVMSAKGGDASGGVGSAALQLDDDNVVIDNTAGSIYAPGGGGVHGLDDGLDGYGGAGGGQGFNGGVHSTGHNAGSDGPGGDGSDGSKTSPGSGAQGALSPVLTVAPDGTSYHRKGGRGGDGGGFGQDGHQSGGRASDGARNSPGGAAGRAIVTNSRPYTIVGGNNPSQIVGAIV